MTSFGGTNILDKFLNPKPRRPYLPIYPTSPHPDTAAQLFLEKRRVLSRESYVNTRDKHTVPFDILVAYRPDPDTRYALTRESYQQVILHAGLVPDLYTMPIGPPASTSNAIPLPPIPPSPYTPPSIRTQPERLKLSPVSVPQTPLLNPSNCERQYGAVPGARTPVLVGLNNRDPYGTARSGSHTTPTVPSVRHNTTQHRASDQDILPRHHTRTDGYNSTSNGGYGTGRQEALSTLAWLTIRLALLGAGIYGLWSAWTYRGELGHGLLRGLSWVGVHAWQLAKGAVGGIVRCMVWLVKLIASGGKTLAMKVWGWLRGVSGGGGVKQALL